MFRRVNTTYGYTIYIHVFEGGPQELIVSKCNGIFFLKVAKGSLGVTLLDSLREAYRRNVVDQRESQGGSC